VRAGGTGLGLYVVKGILEAIGGSLDVESVDHVGSTFTAVLPLNVKLDEDKARITEKILKRAIFLMNWE
jgi:signal transduction histidine kinase